MQTPTQLEKKLKTDENINSQAHRERGIDISCEL